MAETLIILFGIKVTWWKILGWTGVLMFTGRWLVQMYFSRKAGKPVLPRMYWFMSLSGSFILLTYFCLSPQRGTVGFLSNFFPVFVAGYNLMLDVKNAARNALAASPVDTGTGEQSLESCQQRIAILEEELKRKTDEALEHREDYASALQENLELKRSMQATTEVDERISSLMEKLDEMTAFQDEQVVRVRDMMARLEASNRESDLLRKENLRLRSQT